MTSSWTLIKVNSFLSYLHIHQYVKVATLITMTTFCTTFAYIACLVNTFQRKNHGLGHVVMDIVAGKHDKTHRDTLK